jgi:tryptophanyl-tRNA synthetase
MERTNERTPRRLLTGIQSSGKPHLGNLLGAILPAIALSAREATPAYYFIADLHTLTSSKDAARNRAATYDAAAAWLACGLDPAKDCFYRQSDLPEVTELTWYLSCHAPYPMLANAHSFKDKQANLADVNAGLFTYPVLMAADIVLYDATHVPVGRDQQQHLEMTRDIASALNRAVGAEVLVIPAAVIDEAVMTIPGTDGRKMSKSYGNTIDVFAPEKELKKAVMGIVTDSLPVEAPKDPDANVVYQLFKLVAEAREADELAGKLRAGGFGYGDAKKWLLEVLLRRFAFERMRHAELRPDEAELDRLLALGAAKAREVGSGTLARVRRAMGYR